MLLNFHNVLCGKNNLVCNKLIKLELFINDYCLLCNILPIWRFLLLVISLLIIFNNTVMNKIIIYFFINHIGLKNNLTCEIVHKVLKSFLIGTPISNLFYSAHYTSSYRIFSIFYCSHLSLQFSDFTTVNFLSWLLHQFTWHLKQIFSVSHVTCAR